MFDIWMTLAALTHLFVLAGGIVWACRRWGLPRRDWPFALYLMLWTDLVFAGHLASLVNSLNRLDVYVPATLLAMGAVLAIFRYVDKAATVQPLLVMPQLSFTSLENPRVRKFLIYFFGATFAFAAISSIMIGMSVYPDNADSMIYRLPRAFWYVSNGSFLHPFKSLDNRITYYPLDGVALYVPLVLYNLPGTMHSLPSLAAWFLLVYTVYRFARALGAERLLAFLATWLVALTPSILAQATSTNDEIFTAVVLLVSLYMAWRWLITGRHGYFLLAAMAFGLSVGTKLHILFLLPIIFAALGLAAWHVRQKPDLLRRWIGSIGWRTGLVSLAMAVVLIVPFLFYNYASTGRFYFFGEFEHDVFNLRGSLRGALQNLLIYVSQMVFAPIADLNSWPVANDRQHFNNMLNAIFDPILRPLIDTDQAYYHMGYRFVGITIPVSVRFVEFSLWSGFIWLLWPLQARLSLKQKFPLRGLFFLLAVTPPVWLLFWSCATLYMEGTATYFTFYLICAAPAAVFSFAPIRRTTWHEVRWLAVVFVALTNLVISTNMFMFSGFRALPDLIYARTWPYDWDLVEPRVIEEIRRAEHIRIVLLHEKMPYFAYMHWNPRAHYYTPYPVDNLPNFNKVLQILPISSMDRYGYTVLKIPGKKTVGATYIGTIRGIGREAIFATGNDVEKRYPDESNYILPNVSLIPASGGPMVQATEKMLGLSPEDQLEFSYEIRYNGEVVFERDWSSHPGFKIHMPDYDPFQRTALLTIKVRSGWNHKEITRATMRLGGPGLWLPEGGEY